jgi:hypothetical protein
MPVNSAVTAISASCAARRVQSASTVSTPTTTPRTYRRTRARTPVAQQQRGRGGNQPLGRGVREQIADHAQHDSHTRRREPGTAQIAGEFRQVQARDLRQRPPPEARVHMTAVLLGVVLQSGRRQILRREPALPPLPHTQPRLHAKPGPPPDGELLLIRVLLRRALACEPGLAPVPPVP